ncbi:MAG: helix-turn-helix domain-containing protein [Aggregatilineales bacterium]
MVALLTYEYRIYPRKRQCGLLEQMLEQGRQVYNAALRQCRNAFEATSIHPTAISHDKHLELCVGVGRDSAVRR